MEKAKETLVVTWCDNGSTDSLFTSSLSALMMHINYEIKDVKAVGINQVIGNQIARQRGDSFRNFEEMDCDWLLSVDSDIVINVEAFDMLWKYRNPITHPIISGIYFISYEMNSTLPAPVPSIFKLNDKNEMRPIHPLPEKQLIQIDSAGLGFTLIHKSVIHKLRKTYGNTTFQITIGDTHVSEDMSFFYKLKELGIPVYAYTGAFVDHIKRFSFDQNYYNLWWNIVAPMREAKENAKK